MLWRITTNRSSIIDHFSGERVLRSRQHDRGTSQERRYKRSHRRSPSSGRQHGHRDRDRDRLAHPTSSRRARIYRHHVSSSTSQDRHRHRSPSSRSQVSLNGADNRRERRYIFLPGASYIFIWYLYCLTTSPPRAYSDVFYAEHSREQYGLDLNEKSFLDFRHESITRPPGNPLFPKVSCLVADTVVLFRSGRF